MTSHNTLASFIMQCNGACKCPDVNYGNAWNCYQIEIRTDIRFDYGILQKTSVRLLVNMKKVTDIVYTNMQPWNGKAILLVDLDAFFASVEQLDHPSWRGKPVIVGGNADAHGVVSTCSYEARAFGVRSAMPASQAKKLCPDAVWCPGHFARYKEMSRKVMDILLQESPFLQQVSIDEAFLDVSPNSVNVEHPILIAQRIQAKVQNLGISCSIGLGTTKTIAKIASDMDKPRGLTVVYPGMEQQFLHPLPVGAISGIGPVSQNALAGLGITTIGQLAQAPDQVLKRVFGKNQELMRARAQGKDYSPVESPETAKSISTELTFAQDLLTHQEILRALETITAKTCRRARTQQVKGHVATVKVKYHNRTTKSAQAPLPHPMDNEFELMPILQKLVTRVWNPGQRVRLLGVSLSIARENQGDDFERGFTPPLFDSESSTFAGDSQTTQTKQGGGNPDTSRIRISPASGERLAHAADRIKDRFGESAVYYGREDWTYSNTTGTAPKNPADYLK